MKKLISINPFTRTVNKQFTQVSRDELSKSIKRASEGFKIQQKRTVKDKVVLLESFANNVQKNNDKLANLISIQMGKPIKQSKDEVTSVEKHARNYAQSIDTFLKQTIINSDAKIKTQIKYNPLGVLYYIVPFNYPFYLIFRGGLGNLILGNSLLVRPSPLTPMLAQFTQQLMQQSGFNNGEYQSVFSSTQDLDYIMSDPNICGVHFTGSSKTGSIIAQSAGKHLKKSVLELGGNDPFIVLEDAHVQNAVNTVIKSRLANAGQVCFAPKRIIITGNASYDSFKNKLLQKIKQIKYGDPLDLKTQLGPLASQRSHNILTKQLKQIPQSWNLLYKSNVKQPFFPIHVYQGDINHPYLQQLFGPVFVLFKVRDENQAIEVANQGQYGLGATCFSKDSNRAQKVLQQVRAGMTFVNTFPRVGTHLPNGGVAQSGYGRQCGIQGFHQFANVKLYYVN